MKNNKLQRLLSLFMFISVNVNLCFSQDIENNNIYHFAEVPDSIVTLLDTWYAQQNQGNVIEYAGVGRIVHKLGVMQDDTQFSNGVYVFHGLGPHFPWFMFIHYNKKIYIFKHRIDKDILLSNILSDFIEAQEELGIEGPKGLLLLKIITDYFFMDLYDTDWKVDEEIEND